MSFCRITGKSRNLPKPHYFPLIPPISPSDARRCRITGKSFGLPMHHYIPVLLRKSNFTSKCRITKVADMYGKRKHYPHIGFRYVRPLLDIKDEKQKALIALLTTKKGEGQFVYTVKERKCGVIFSAQLEHAVRDGTIKDVMMAKDSDKVLLKMKQGENVSVDIKELNEEEYIDEELYEGEGMCDDENAKKKKQNKFKMGLVQMFEEKELSAIESDVQSKKKIKKKENKTSVMINGEDWRDLIQPLIESWDWSKFEEEAAKSIPTSEWNIQNAKKSSVGVANNVPVKKQNISPFQVIQDALNKMTPEMLEKSKNALEKIASGGKRISQSIPQIQETDEIIKKLSTGVLTEVANIPGMTVFTERSKFVAGQVIQTITGQVFVPGQTITSESGDHFVPGMVVNTNEGPALIPGFIMSKQKHSAKFVAGQNIIQQDGTSTFVPEKTLIHKSEIIRTTLNDIQCSDISISENGQVCQTIENANENIINDVNMTDMKEVLLKSGLNITGSVEFDETLQTVKSNICDLDLINTNGVISDMIINGHDDGQLGTNKYLNNMKIAYVEGQENIILENKDERNEFGIADINMTNGLKNIDKDKLHSVTEETNILYDSECVNSNNTPGNSTKRNSDVSMEDKFSIEKIQQIENNVATGKMNCLEYLDPETGQIIYATVNQNGGDEDILDSNGERIKKHFINKDNGLLEEYPPNCLEKYTLRQENGLDYSEKYVEEIGDNTNISENKLTTDIRLNDVKNKYYINEALVSEIENNSNLKLDDIKNISKKLNFEGESLTNVSEIILNLTYVAQKILNGENIVNGNKSSNGTASESLSKSQCETENVLGNVLNVNNKSTNDCVLKNALLSTVRILQTRPDPKYEDLYYSLAETFASLQNKEVILEELCKIFQNTETCRSTLNEIVLENNHKLPNVSKVDVLKSAIKANNISENVIIEKLTTVLEEDDNLAAEFENLSKGNSLFLKKIVQHISENINSVSTDEQASDILYKAIVSVVKDTSELKLNEFLQQNNENQEEVKELFKEAIGLAVALGMRDTADTLFAILSDPRSTNILSGDAVTLEILKRLTIMRQIAESNPSLHPALSNLKQNPHQAKTDPKLRELVRKSAVLMTPEIKLQSSENIPARLFQEQNTLAMEDFLYRNRKHGILMIIKNGLQAVVPKEASRLVLNGTVAYTLIDETGIRHFKPLHVLSAMRFSQPTAKRFSMYECLGVQKQPKQPNCNEDKSRNSETGRLTMRAVGYNRRSASQRQHIS